MPTFLGDALMFPPDGPLGRHGPNLEKTLRSTDGGSDESQTLRKHQLTRCEQQKLLAVTEDLLAQCSQTDALSRTERAREGSAANGADLAASRSEPRILHDVSWLDNIRNRRSIPKSASSPCALLRGYVRRVLRLVICAPL